MKQLIRYCRRGSTLYMWGGFRQFCEATGSGGFSEVGAEDHRAVVRFNNHVWRLVLPSSK